MQWTTNDVNAASQTNIHFYFIHLLVPISFIHYERIQLFKVNSIRFLKQKPVNPRLEWISLIPISFMVQFFM